MHRQPALTQRGTLLASRARCGNSGKKWATQRTCLRAFSPIASEPCAESSTIDTHHSGTGVTHNLVATIAASKADVPAPVTTLPTVTPTVVAGVAAAAIAMYAIKKVFDTPSRTYDQNVGDEYDNWTSDVRSSCSLKPVVLIAS